MKRRSFAQQQRGVSLIAAIFLVTGMAVLGALLTRLLIVGTQEGLQEWYSSQALYAAETGVNWARRRYRESCLVVCSVANATATDMVVIANRSWFDVATVATLVDGQTVLLITSTGHSGFNAASNMASRQLVVTTMQ